MTDAPVNSEGRSIKPMPSGLRPFKKGHPKVGGMKKGYKSTAIVIRELLQRVTEGDDGEEITLREAALLKQIDLAIKEGDRSALTFLFRQAKDLVEETQSADPVSNNFLNIESFKQIIGGSNTLELDEPDIIEEESEVIEEPNETDSDTGSLGGTTEEKV